jgi:two-component system NtrC family response regulator
LERAHILKVYERTGRNKSETAKLLGIGFSTLRRKIEEYGKA